MKIAVAGCGIAGTAVAIFLKREGHDVTILERAERIGPVGAGIMLQRSGQRVLNELGLLDQITQNAEHLDGIVAVLTSGKTLVNLDFSDLSTEHFSLGVHRGDLFMALHDACVDAGVKIVTGFEVGQVQVRDDSIRLISANGRESEPFDFVIAADGSRSKLRELMNVTRRDIEYEHAALWATGTDEKFARRLFQFVDGTSRLAGVLPVGFDRFSFFWGIHQSELNATREAGIESWKSEAQRVCQGQLGFLDQFESFDDMTLATYRRVSVKSCFVDRIVLLGDAWHAMSPHLGQGACLALEDAESFAEQVGLVISEQSSADVADQFQEVCKRYQKARTRKIRYYRSITNWLSPYFQSSSWWRGRARNVALPMMTKVPSLRNQMLRTLCGIKNSWLG